MSNLAVDTETQLRTCASRSCRSPVTSTLGASRKVFVQQESEEEVRRILQAAFGTLALHGELPPSEHYATLDVLYHPEAWVQIYGDYMDFSYAEQAPPETLLAEVLASLQSAQIIDWCPGRLATVQYKAADAVTLSKTIDALLKKLYGFTDYKLVGTLKTWQRA